MLELFIIGFLILFVIIFVSRRDNVNELKRNGIKVTGTIIRNNELSGSNNERLGGNINDPTVQFLTTEGQEIIGKPVMGFVTQFELPVPCEVHVIYDPKKPKKFCVVFG